MNTKHLYAGAILLAIFLLGATVGATGMYHLQALRKPEPPPPVFPHPSRIDRMLKELTLKLHLTPEQIAAMRPVMIEQAEAAEALHEETREKAKALLMETTSEIEALLTEDQLPLYRELLRRRMPPMPPPRQRPGPNGGNPSRMPPGPDGGRFDDQRGPPPPPPPQDGRYPAHRPPPDDRQYYGPPPPEGMRDMPRNGETRYRPFQRPGPSQNGILPRQQPGFGIQQQEPPPPPHPDVLDNNTLGPQPDQPAQPTAIAPETKEDYKDKQSPP